MSLRVLLAVALLAASALSQPAFRGGGGGGWGHNQNNNQEDLSQWPAVCTDKLISTDYDDLDTPSMKPFILMTRGRSGSTVLADTIEKLANGYVDPVRPVTIELLNELWEKVESDPVKMVHRWLQNQCRRQERIVSGDVPMKLQNVELVEGVDNHTFARSKLIGFKWKIHESFTPQHRKLIKGLIAKQKMRVIFFERNYLDFQISTAKHAVAPWLPSHCDPEMPNYDHCMKETKSLQVCLHPEGLDYIFDQVNEETNTHLEALDAAGIPYERFWYADLFQSDNHTAYWTKLMNFLGRPGPVTSEDMDKVGGKKKTTSDDQRDVLINYDAVAKFIREQKSEYAYFLHGSEVAEGAAASTTRCTPKNTF